MVLNYIPILKGRLGELQALKEMDASTKRHVIPLVEFAPGAPDLDENGDVRPESISKDLESFATRLSTRWLDHDRIIIDGGAYDSQYSIEATKKFAQKGVRFTPVIRPSDSDSTLTATGDWITKAGLDGACIRLSGEDLDDANEPLSSALDRVLTLANLSPNQVDVVLDFSAVTDGDSAKFAARIARIMLGEIPSIKDWRILSVGAGAFPADLNKVQADVLTGLPRHDAAMWNRVKNHAVHRVPDYSDYGVANPLPALGVAFAPAPQLRYTAEGEWLVMKGRRSERRGSAQFYDICLRISEHKSFTPNLSWGDIRIAQGAHAAVVDPPPPGTGNATTWRAIGTSHHIAYVANRLANVGAP